MAHDNGWPHNEHGITKNVEGCKSSFDYSKVPKHTVDCIGKPPRTQMQLPKPESTQR